MNKLNELNKLRDKIQSHKIIELVKPFLKDTQTYLVGGFLRDLALDRESCDVDLVVEKNIAGPLAKKIADGLHGYFVPLDEVNKIYRVVMEDKVNYIDIAELIGKDIFEDLKRRDFTINALCFDLSNDEFINDNWNNSCFEDIKSGIIKEISEKNIVDDPLRILRAFRFRSELGFKINDSLKAILKKHSQKLDESAKERVNTELVKLFAGENASGTILAMDEAGVLELIFPEIKEIKKIPPNSHHHLDLFHHSVEIVNQLEKYLKTLSDEAREHFDSIDLGGNKRTGYLKLAAFLHDAGKPQTWTIEEETQRHRFFKHDDVGSKLIAPTLKKLKFSNKQIKYIQKLVKYHIYPANVVAAENFNEKNEKSAMKFYRKMGDEVFDVIAISHCDRLSVRGPAVTEEMVNNNINGLKTLTENYIKIKDNFEPLPKLLDGKEIMEILNIKAGPQLGKVIKALHEAQLLSEVKTKDEALAFVTGNFIKSV